MEINVRNLAEELRREVEGFLSKSGLLCRVFARGKSTSSLKRKIDASPGKYVSGGKLIQDIIGIRIAVYFEEDVDIVDKLLKANYQIDSDASMVDSHSADIFKVKRHNLIVKVPSAYLDSFNREIRGLPIDATFEVQLRSILSEGWHEVDHDLRYKLKGAWSGQDDLDRALNGVFATLETAEWSMKQLFDELSYRHYKKQSWVNMLVCKLRMRVEPQLSQPILDILNEGMDVGKEVFRIDRRKIISRYSKFPFSLPITLDNVIHVWNFDVLQNEKLTALCPTIVSQILKDSPSAQ